MVRAVTRVGDLAVLSLMWFVGGIPVVTIGASNTAVYSAIHKVFSQKEGIAAAEYLKSFKGDFRQATLSFLPLGALELLLLAECFVTEFLQEQGTAWVNLRPVPGHREKDHLPIRRPGLGQPGKEHPASCYPLRVHLRPPGFSAPHSLSSRFVRMDRP